MNGKMTVEQFVDKTIADLEEFLDDTLSDAENSSELLDEDDWAGKVADFVYERDNE